MSTTISVGEITLEVIHKNIKNVHLSVYPPTGRVRIAAPSHMDLETVRLFAISKISWIRRNQKRHLNQERETPREFIERESHYLWGKRLLLKVVEKEAVPVVQAQQRFLKLQVRPGASRESRADIMGSWYRGQIRSEAEPLIALWEKRLGIKVKGVYVQQMKTRWGSCNSRAESIRLNTELAKKSKECLEYIIVHEMIHILIPNHGKQFQGLLSKHLPNWQNYRDQLNSSPMSHSYWEY